MSNTELQEVARGNDTKEEVSETKEDSEIIGEPEDTEEMYVEGTEAKEIEGKEESKVPEETKAAEEEKIESLEYSTSVGDQNGEVKDEVVEAVPEPVEEEVEEILEEVPDNILSEEIIKECISLLRRTGNGLGYSFIKLDLSNKKLTDISILEGYIHLRIVNVSNNYLTTLKPFNSLTDLLQLTANNNRISSIMLDPCPFLQYISLKNNKLKDISEGISHPLVRYIDLSNNKIEKLPPFDGTGFFHLTTLKIEENRIQNIEKFNIPNLKVLHLGNNKITSTEWVSELVNLEELKLNNNLIEKVHGFNSNMQKLTDINLQGNKFARFIDIHQMSVLPQLKSMMLHDNPLAEDGDYRVEVLNMLKTLTVLDEEEFTEDEVADARDIGKQHRASERQPSESILP